jgi:hypothetical protein
VGVMFNFGAGLKCSVAALNLRERYWLQRAWFANRPGRLSLGVAVSDKLGVRGEFQPRSLLCQR